MPAIKNLDAKIDECSVNVLPCRIHHNGPSKVTKQYWNPVRESDGSRVSHFRGRRLKGRALKIPEGYQGFVVKSTEKTLPLTDSKSKYAQPNVSSHSLSGAVELDDGDDEDDDDDEEPVKILESVSNIDEIVIWGHDQHPPSDDAFVKGVEEWLSFANAIHSTSESTPS